MNGRKMMKKLILTVALSVLCACSAAAAPKIDKNPAVAVMDFGTHPGAATADIALANAEGTTSEYVIAKLLSSNRYNVIDKDMARTQLQAAGIRTVGLIDPASARTIGQLLNVRYIIYGNVNDVSASDVGTNLILIGGVKVHTVKAHVIARIMDVTDGTILMAAKGEGVSKSSYTDVNALVGGITIGNAIVTQESVHNALQKAAYQAVELLDKRLYGIAKR